MMIRLASQRDARRTAFWPRFAVRAFTLTELLVVIAIVAILAAFSGVAVMRAVDTAKQTRIKTEIDQLHAAFEAYKQQYGSYPPCDLRIDPAATPGQPFYNAALRRHLAQAFPMYNPKSNLAFDIQSAGVDVYNFRPDQALVFWLSGFNRDPARPLAGLPGLSTPERTTVFFEFDPARLSDGVTFRSKNYPGVGSDMGSYFPPGVQFTDTDASVPPYVYFDSSYYELGSAQPVVFNTSVQIGSTRNLYGPSSYTEPTFPNAGAVTSYWNDVNGNGSADAGEGWMNPNSFQIIAAGGDGKYGADAIGARLFKSGVGYDLADDDNVANFCPRPRLGDARP